MVSIIYSGRLGNNLFQYVAAYIFAKKFNFKLITDIVENKFNIPPLNNESNYHNKIIDVSDDNFLNLLNSTSVEPAHYRFIGYYQIKKFILEYRDEIKKLFNLLFLSVPKDDVFVVYRIGDILGERQMLPIEYFKESLIKMNCKNGYITSDSPEHPNVKQLISEFNLTLYNDTPINTIDFAKNFNKLILSEGSFSWWIGFLSNAKKIYFNKRDRFWHGDIFVLPEWEYLSYDWDLSCIGNRNKLNCDKIIKL
jgi:hypothetical protein